MPSNSRRIHRVAAHLRPDVPVLRRAPRELSPSAVRCGGILAEVDHGVEVVAEAMEEKARRVIGEFLGKRSVGLEELRERRKGDSLKIELAEELRARTAMSMGWIAKELNAGAPKSVWNALRGRRKTGGS